VTTRKASAAATVFAVATTAAAECCCLGSIDKTEKPQKTKKEKVILGQIRGSREERCMENTKI